MGPILQSCRSRRESYHLHANPTPSSSAPLSNLDRELNQLSDAESGAEGDDGGQGEVSGAGSDSDDSDHAEQEGYDLTGSASLSKFGVQQFSQNEEKSEEVEEVPLSQSPAFVQYCEKWLDLGKLEEKFEEIKGREHGEGDGEEKSEGRPPMTRVLNIDYFQILFKSVFFWKKMRFEDIKEVFYRQRRAILFAPTSPDMLAYRNLNRQMDSLEGQCMQEVVTAILEKVGLSEDEFTDNVDYYKQDPVNYPKLKEITTITQDAMLELKMRFLGQPVKS